MSTPTSKKKFRLFPSIITFILIVVVTLGFFFFLQRDRTLATVGDYKITVQDVKYRDQINHVFYPEDANSYGLVQLTKSYTYAQILKNNGLEITEQTLRAEEMRINKNSKDPATLRKIQEIFKEDDDSYQKVFVLPTYAERTIFYDFFNGNQKIQAKSLDQVRIFLTQLKSSKKSLAEFAKLENKAVKTFIISSRDGMIWNESNATLKNEKRTSITDKSSTAPIAVQAEVDSRFKNQSQENAEFWIEKVLPRLNPGDILPEPVDFGERWLVVKYIKTLGQGKFQMEAVAFPKNSYEEWFEAEKAKVQIR